MENSLKMLEKIRKPLDSTLSILVTVTVGFLVIDVSWQILTRFASKIAYYLSPDQTFINPSSWTEELATILLMWVGLLAAALALGKKAHLGVDFLTQKFSTKVQAYIEIAVYTIILGFSICVMIIGGIQLMTRTLSFSQPLPTLGIEMGYVYLCLPLSGLGIAIYSLLFVIEKISHLLNQKVSQ